jgi:hypothetical protein
LELSFFVVISNNLMFIQTIESQKKSTSGLPCTLNLGASLPVAWQCPLIVPLGQVPFVDGQITYCKKKTWFARKSSITAGFSYFSWIGKSPCQYRKSFQNRISEAGALQKFVPAGPWLALAAS